MKKGNEDAVKQNLETKGQEFIKLVYLLTEDYLHMGNTVSTTARNRALAAAALAVQESIKTFLAMTKVT